MADEPLSGHIKPSEHINKAVCALGSAGTLRLAELQRDYKHEHGSSRAAPVAVLDSTALQRRNSSSVLPQQHSESRPYQVFLESRWGSGQSAAAQRAPEISQTHPPFSGGSHRFSIQARLSLQPRKLSRSSLGLTAGMGFSSRHAGGSGLTGCLETLV